MDGFIQPREDPLFAEDYDSDNSYQAEELPEHEPDDAAAAEQNPLGEWNPRVAISRHAMDLANLEAQAAALNPPQSRPNSREPGPFTIPKEFHNGPWEETFPNHVRPPAPQRAHQPSEVDWDGWDLLSDNPGTGHSARAFRAWLQRNPRRCTNAECQFTHTQAVGSNLITRHNPHDFWDPKWTLRTGIGTGLPGYSHEATMNAIRRQEEEKIRREIAMMHQENQPMYDANHGDSGNDTCGTSNLSRFDDRATAVDARDMFSPTGESSKIPMKRKRETPQNVLDDFDMDIDMDTDNDNRKDKGKGKAKEEPPAQANMKSKTLMPPAEIQRSVKRHLNFEAYRTPGKSTLASIVGDIVRVMR